MAKYKPYNYAQTRMVPVDLENQLMPGTLEHAIHYMVDNHINMEIFDEKFKNDETGAPGFDPRSMLKIVLNGRGCLGSDQAKLLIILGGNLKIGLKTHLYQLF